jgi:hypothetical protein
MGVWGASLPNKSTTEARGHGENSQRIPPCLRASVVDVLLPRIQYPLMRIPLWLKVVWTACVIAWIPLYWRQYGLQNFLFFCDLGNLWIVAGLWLESTLIFSWQACSLLLFQTLFTVDLLSTLVSGRHLIGGTEYMFDPNVPLPIRLLSLFHVVTPPLLLWAISRLGYDERGWKFQTLTAWIVVPINYFWRPQYDVNWARGPFFHEQHVVPGSAYLLAYVIIVPVAIYYPTHRFLLWFAGRPRIRN